MPNDATYLTSDEDYKPVRYISDSQQVQTILSLKLSMNMLVSANDYTKVAEAFKREAFPETEPGLGSRVPGRYYLSDLKSFEGKIKLREELEVELSREDGLFFFQNYRFNIFGHGLTKEEALKDFSEFFIHDYLSYKNTPLEDLTRDARQLLGEYESAIAGFESA